MKKNIKIVFFALLFIGATIFFGTMCKSASDAYKLIVNPDRKKLIEIVAWFLAAVLAVIISSGFIAVLIKKTSIQIVIFILSPLSLLGVLGINTINIVFVLIYTVGIFMYTLGVAENLKTRLIFSIRSLAAGQGLLLACLVLVFCRSIYFGYAEHYKKNGITIPDSYINLATTGVTKQFSTRIPEEMRKKVIGKFKKDIKKTVNKYLANFLKPYERYIPLAVTVAVFMSLFGISRLAGGISIGLLGVLFFLLRKTGIVNVVKKTCEIEVMEL